MFSAIWTGQCPTHSTCGEKVHPRCSKILETDGVSCRNYIEFTVGIIAGSLPTIKPLFNSFLNVAKALTSGTRSKNASYHAKGSRNSTGYRKTKDKSIPMDSFGTSSSPTSSKAQDAYSVHVTGLADKEAWEAQRKGSDESNFPLRPAEALRSEGIVMTREVSIV
jgi:hypothetical protein